MLLMRLAYYLSKKKKNVLYTLIFRCLLILKDSWSGLFILSRLFYTFFPSYSYGFCQMDNELFVSDAHSSKGDKARFSGVKDFQNDIVSAEECIVLFIQI